MKDRFVIVLSAVLGLTLLCVVLALLVAVTYPTPSPLVERIFNSLLEMFGVGAGTIFGLLAGNAMARQRRTP